MNIIQFRRRIINIAKNIKYSGNHFPNSIINKIENIINCTYNLQIKNIDFIRQKLNIIVKKYSLNVENNQICFHDIVENTDMNVLYRQLYDFLYKVDYVINIINNENNLEEIFNLISDTQLDDYTVIPMNNKSDVAERYDNTVNNFLTQQLLLKDLVINENPGSAVGNVSSNAKNMMGVLEQTYTIQQIKQSDVSNLLD